ncbi:unnamed protein product [Ilex paraguariensis]|uniref:AT-hook motif nuclear-localized protein n=1 Tax=Ilex paraguariensis TaxID=185542 RepID=A0ABC8S062_9AQUA
MKATVTELAIVSSCRGNCNALATAGLWPNELLWVDPECCEFGWMGCSWVLSGTSIVVEYHKISSNGLSVAFSCLGLNVALLIGWKTIWLSENAAEMARKTNRLLDVLAKLMTFSQNTTRAVCILSANGAISNVTLRQASTSGGTVTYEGRFEILSLSGSFLLTESGGQRSRTGGLSVSLAGPDGRVLGGGVAGLLTAAAPVQVVVGSFMADGRKQSKSGQAEGLISPPKLASGASGGSPQSRGTLSESSGGPGSPLNQSTGACNNNNPQGMATMPWR